MTNWQTKKLGDIVTIVSGGTPDTSNPAFWGGDVQWITPSEITKIGRLITDPTEKQITALGLQSSSAVLIPENSIILCSRATIGECAINTYPITTNQGFKNLIAKKEVDYKFLYYWVKANTKSLKRISSGSTFLEFSKNDIEKQKINLPEKPEQERIVGVLEVWDEYIEKLEQKIALKEQLKKGLMQQLLTGKRRLPGFKKDWQTVKLGSISRIKTGGKDNQNKVANGTYPFFVRSPQIERINSYCFDGEAILVPGEGNIGKIFHYINGKFDYHQRVYGITHFADNVSVRYIYYFFVKNFARQAEKHSVKATVDSLRLPTFSNFIINLPSLDEQLAIVKVLDGLAEEVKLSENKLKKINKQKKYLLKNLITGAIRTPEDLQPLDTSRLERSAL